MATIVRHSEMASISAVALSTQTMLANTVSRVKREIDAVVKTRGGGAVDLMSCRIEWEMRWERGTGERLGKKESQELIGKHRGWKKVGGLVGKV